ncbi:hypothetical protein [Actinocrinis sp.]|uniref:hypothetical protein n=1 Tax=Actinocrinis sp. TaxID=1920516 RepID=UPI002B7DB3F8|nr:hypothetical protein [Actinocrinis sp.]HXR74018.1 hypothetical protein [Actinocrinis sp.]
MSLAQAHGELRAALEPLGIEVGPEILAQWKDLAQHGGQPLPADALRRLAVVAKELATSCG